MGLNMKSAGNFCLDLTIAGTVIEDCTEAGVFSLVAVPEFDPRDATGAKAAFAMLRAAAKRQGELLSKLQAALPLLQSCQLPASLMNSVGQAGLATAMVQRVKEQVNVSGPAMDAISKIYPAADVDMANINQLVADTGAALQSVKRMV